MSNIEKDNTDLTPENKANFKLSVVAYLSDWNDSLMLVKQKDNTWGLPAGKVRFDEDPLSGILRECVEETGLKRTRLEIDFIQRTPFSSSGFFFSNLDGNKYFIGLLFNVSYDGVFLKSSQIEDEDVIEAKAFNLDELLILLSNSKREDWYKSEYDVNRLLAISWVVDRYNSAFIHGGRKNINIENVMRNFVLIENIPGLFWDVTDNDRQHPFVDWRIMSNSDAHKIWKTLNIKQRIITQYAEQDKVLEKIGYLGRLSDEEFYIEAQKYDYPEDEEQSYLE
jgi:8-oxo-dGTP pyrophosphatase MutT (NUDIX family)